MKKRTFLKEQLEPGRGREQKLKTKLASLALVGTLIAGGATNGTAQELKTQEKREDSKEILVQAPAQAQSDTLTTFEDATKLPGIEPDPIEDDLDQVGEGETSTEPEEEKTDKKGGIDVHGMLYGGTGVAGDFAEVCSDRGTLIAVVDMSHPQTGLGFTGIRLDDFHNDPDQPASRATVLNLHWNKNFGKFGLGVEGKYTFIDHLPQANGFSPDVVLSYTIDKGRSFEGVYTHKFMNGPDSDVFRLSITKKVNDALNITGQGWYETGYGKHFYGRVIVDVNLGNGFGAQLSCIAKYGKLTPTAGVIYQF